MSELSVLVLGGTSWVGGQVASAARDAGHDVTCVARGEAGSAPTGVRFVRADRDSPGAYEAVSGRDWDLVLDVSWQPGQVRGAVEALAERAAHWVYVSSCSVYADQSRPGMDEGTDLLEPLAPEVQRAGREDYGRAKVRCEHICVDALGDRVLLARAGLIAGYGDLSDRFGYWAGRLALAHQDGRPVLVPDAFEGAPAQAIDVADLVVWMLDAGMRGVSGPLNAVGPHWSFGEVLAAAVAATGFDGELVPVPSPWLLGQGVEEYMGPRSLPLWFADPAYAGFSDRSGAAARAAGLVPSDLRRLTANCLRWERELGLDRPERRAGLHRADELALLDTAARQG